MDSRTRRLAYLGLMIALAVVLNRFASIRIPIGGIEGVRVGFGHFPVILAGILYGPLAGFVVGGLSDVIGYLMSPMGPYAPHFTLAWALTGAIPALVISLVKPRLAAPPSFGLLLLAVGVGQAISSLFLVTYFLDTVFGLPWPTTIIPRLVSQAITVPAYAALMHILMRRVPGLAPRWEVAAVKAPPGTGG